MSQSMSNKSKGVTIALYSLLGIFMFFVPITIGKSETIPLDHLVTAVRKIPNFEYLYSGIIVTIGGLLPFLKKTWNKSISTKIFSILKLLGIVFILMSLFKTGPAFLMDKNVIPFIHNKIVISVITIIPIGAVFLAFLVDFGLMEFIGVFMQPVMRPLWRTPGRSAVDAVASFVGSYSLALLITNRVYIGGRYTSREASIIATGFSTVSATFMVIVAKTLGIMSHWLLYFWITFFVTFIVTAITARIYPLSKKTNEYYAGQEGYPEKLVEGSRWNRACEDALLTFDRSPTLLQSVYTNLKDGVMLTLAVGPMLMSIGVLGILIATYTPVFDIIGYIFYPFTYIVGCQEPMLAAKACALSIAEMFLPALLVTKASLFTKFLIAVVSISEILFFSASIPCMMATEIPLTMKDYLLIWVERVILSILVAAPFLYFFL